MAKYFGTDGIRGKSPEWLDAHKAYKIGYALGHGLSAQKVYVGRDTRKTGLMLNQALNQGLLDTNVNPINLGVVSTPMVQYLSYVEQCFGVMITASHNPASDNGIKIIKNGQKSYREDEIIIESYIDQVDLKFDFYSEIQENPTDLNLYFSDLRALDFQPSSREVFLDTAHGSLSQWGREILGEFANIKGTIGNQPDGVNINQDVGSTSLKTLMNHKPDGVIGLAFDGDGDRLIAIDEHGKHVTGDQILSIINQQLNIDTQMVFTKMLNPGIKLALNNLGIETLETDIGDKYVIQALMDNQISIGGEDSGHMIFTDVWPIGDGLISALLLIKALEKGKSRLVEAAKPFQKYPEILLNIKNIHKEDFQSNEKLQKELSTLNKSLDNHTKVLIRPSGTEPVIRVYLSHKNKNVLNDLADSYIELFNNHGGTL